MRSTIVSLFFILLTVSVVADDSNTAPTSWLWRTGSISTIKAQISRGYRIVDLELYSASPYHHTALFVRNTGTYAQTWWWYYNIDASTLKDKLSLHKARIADLEPYVIKEKLRFSAVLTPNTGSNAKIWWYYYGVSTSFISSQLKKNKARLVDIDRYSVGTSTKYAVVMIKNSGSDARRWWWYYNVKPSVISARLRKNRARLMDIEYNGSGRFSVIMESSSARWYWYYGLTSSDMLARANQNGARLFHVTPYSVGKTRRWAGIMIANLNEDSERVFNYMVDKRSSGSFGFYMKQINGPVHVALLEKQVYEPASSIKALHLAHSMKRISLGADSLGSTISVFTGSDGSCPLSFGGPNQYSLENALRRMMNVLSSNTDTQAVRVRYGEAAINLSAQQLGMSQSRIAHRIGCGTPRPGVIPQVDQPNWLTLVDITTLYSKVATTWLTGSNREKFFEIMLSYSTILSVVDDEASKLPLISSTTVNIFKGMVFARQKGGSYTINSLNYRSIGAYVKLPFKSCSGIISMKEYAIGAFIDKSTTDVLSGVSRTAGAEAMRGEIKKALKSFSPCLTIAPLQFSSSVI